jgi:hypothetical protein
MGDANDPKDSVLDRAESLARRVLERLGSRVDTKLASGNEGLSSLVIGSLASRLERLIESTLRKDEHGIRNVAPNHFKVLFTYEETSALSPQYIEAVGIELTATVFEYINNRRYATRGPVEVEAGQDLFAKEMVMKASFEEDMGQPVVTSKTSAISNSEESKRICLDNTDGQPYRLELKAGGAPAYIGRAAGSAVRIDDPSVSRLHCSLSVRSGGGGVLIADVGSANGTYVNEHLLGRDEARPLKPGDMIGVGDFKLTVSEIS